jgi:hypothetical protein
MKKYYKKQGAISPNYNLFKNIGKERTIKEILSINFHACVTFTISMYMSYCLEGPELKACNEFRGSFVFFAYMIVNWMFVGSLFLF